MRSQLCLTIASLLMSGGIAFGQGAADRASTRYDLQRAQTQGRYNEVGKGEQTETVTKQKVITETVPVREPAGIAATHTESKVKPKTRTKRVVVPYAVTVTTPAPKKINPY